MTNSGERTLVPGLPLGWLVRSVWVPKFLNQEGFTKFTLYRWERNRWRKVTTSKDARELVAYAEATEAAMNIGPTSGKANETDYGD